jgi:hypothetical protein
MKEHFTLRYSATEDNDSIMELDLSFDNPTDELLVKRVQDWLIAIGKKNIIVVSNSVNEKNKEPVNNATINNATINNERDNEIKDKNFYDVD